MIPNLLLLTGEDDFRLRERANFYKTAFLAKFQNGEIDIFDKNSSINDLENAVFTPNLFQQKRLIFCESFWDVDKFELAQKLNFFEKLTETADLCTIITIEPHLDKRKKLTKFLTKNSKVETFTPLEGVILDQWISQQIQKYNGKISINNAKNLVNRCGTNLWNIDKELQKLSMMADDGVITNAMIQEFTIPHPQVIIWDFLANLSHKKLVASIKKFRELLQMGESVHQIFAMIIREIRIHAQIAAGLSQGLTTKTIATQTKLHPFVVQKTVPLSKNFTKNDIKNLYNLLYDLDVKLKTGGIIVSTDDTGEFELALEKIIMKFCKK
jgi:DNA polymerase-3 subunit delta